MWVIAGVLLGLVVLASLLGFHVGPHVHGLAGLLGLVAAGWLLFMAVDGRSEPVLWVLLSADLVVSAGAGLMTWKALTTPPPVGSSHAMTSPQGAEGVAVGDLDPRGIVRVNSEEWSAESTNGFIPRGTRVQVIGGSGVRLEVWGEEAVPDTQGSLGAGRGGPGGGAETGQDSGSGPTGVESERHGS
jgi:membrane-bound ClpP family serine protease